MVGRLRRSLAGMLAVCLISAAFAEEIGWQEAVARLAYERTKAETCVKELKKYGDLAAISRGEDAYDRARDEYNPIVQGLIVALAKKDEPASLPDLESRMKRGIDARITFCQGVLSLVPPSAGQRGAVEEAIKGAVEGAVGPLIDALKAIVLRKQDDDALMRRTIETQLEATSWPAFASISRSP